MKKIWILFLLPIMFAACSTIFGTKEVSPATLSTPVPEQVSINPTPYATVRLAFPTIPATPTEELTPSPLAPTEEILIPPFLETVVGELPPSVTPTMFSLANATPTPYVEVTEIPPAPVVVDDTKRYFSAGGAIVYFRASGREVWLGYLHGGSRIPDPENYRAVVMGLKVELNVPCSTIEGERYDHVLVCIAPKADVDPYLDGGTRVYYRLEKMQADGTFTVVCPPLYRPIETVIYPSTTTPTPIMTRTPYMTSTP